jgi:hypothetical protein
LDWDHLSLLLLLQGFVRDSHTASTEPVEGFLEYLGGNILVLTITRVIDIRAPNASARIPHGFRNVKRMPLWLGTI